MGPAELPLRDIHLPDPVSWWPPAPGWWALLALGLAALAIASLLLAQRRRTRIRRAALRGIETLAQEYARSGDGAALAAGLSVLLRRTCLSLRPRHEVAAVTGEAWLALLEETAGGGPGREPLRFTAGPGRSLADAPYRREAVVDGAALLALCRRWAKALPAGAAQAAEA